MRVQRSALVAASLAVVALTGCGGEADPPEVASHLTIPEVVWENFPPSGDAEETQWAKDYREQRLAEAVAFAYGDYSDPALIATIGYDRAVDLAEWNAEHYPPHVWLGPDGTYTEDAPPRLRPQWEVVTDVIEDGDGIWATMVKCQARWYGQEYESYDACQRVRLTHGDTGTLVYGKPPGANNPSSIEAPEFDDFSAGVLGDTNRSTHLSGPHQDATAA